MATISNIYKQDCSNFASLKRASNAPAEPKNLVLIDKGLVDIEFLISGIKDNYQLLLIDKSDNLEEKLNNFTSKKYVYNISIVCHGDPGNLYLGSEIINKKYIASKSNFFRNLRIDSLFLYSCCVGEDISFVDELSRITNANIFSTAGKVGHFDCDGSWDLQLYGKSTESSNNIIPFSRQAILGWKHNLNLVLEADEVDTLLADVNSFTGGLSGTFSNSGFITILNGTITVTQLNQLDAVTSGAITAVISTTDSTSLATLNNANSNNNLVSSWAAASATALELTTIDSKTSSAPDATAVTLITGTASQVAAVATADTNGPIDVDGDFQVLRE